MIICKIICRLSFFVECLFFVIRRCLLFVVVVWCLLLFFIFRSLSCFVVCHCLLFSVGHCLSLLECFSHHDSENVAHCYCFSYFLGVFVIVFVTVFVFVFLSEFGQLKSWYGKSGFESQNHLLVKKKKEKGIFIYFGQLRKPVSSTSKSFSNRWNSL